LWTNATSFGSRYARPERVHAFEVGRRASQIGLQDDADRVVPVAPQGFEDSQRDVRVGGALHVDANEESGRVGAREDLAQVVGGARFVHVEPELRELERQVALDARVDDGLDDVQVCARRGIGLRQGGDALAEEVECQVQALIGDRPAGDDGLLDGFTGDEPSREAALSPHPVAGGKALEEPAPGDEVEEGLGSTVEHQRARPGVSRCSIVRA
jgi:hypothetical protein